MEEMIHKYARKLVLRGLADEKEPLLGAMDAELIWNRKDPKTEILEKAFPELGVNALLFSRPREPYSTIIEYLCEMSAKSATNPEYKAKGAFVPSLPMAERFSESSLMPVLRRRKRAVIPGYGIVSTGTLTPEQAFVTFSYLCFTSFVNFFSEILRKKRQGEMTAEDSAALNTVTDMMDKQKEEPPGLLKGPYTNETMVFRAIEEAGRKVVSCDLVDSYFGNLSYGYADKLYISQTGSSMDELKHCIDACPLDGSSCVGITASSEFKVHLDIARTTDIKAVLHGHPRFSVIISMDCEEYDCENRGTCRGQCHSDRYFGDIPIVPGGFERGPSSLHKTVPQALKKSGAAIVYGHGVFTTGKYDFNDAFNSMLAIENECLEEYYRRVNI